MSYINNYFIIYFVKYIVEYFFSEITSREELDSSSIRKLEFLNNILAIASFCHCPPESPFPSSNQLPATLLRAYVSSIFKNSASIKSSTVIIALIFSVLLTSPIIMLS